MPLPMNRPAITSEAVAQDAAGTLGFLQALVTGVPGADSLTVADLMAHLEHAKGNPLGLELLARALQGTGTGT